AVVALIAAEKDMLVVITHHKPKVKQKQYYIAALTALRVAHPESAFQGRERAKRQRRDCAGWLEGTIINL
ncbi:MAG TPA: hypothetical protein VFM11_02170, partial [Burkholderiales bacterium]|nr:hypothetical protein [Burkholderiales bacterium]